MRNKIFLIFILLLSCETPTEKDNSKNYTIKNGDIFEINIGQYFTGDEVTIRESDIFRFNITVKDSNLRGESNFTGYYNNDISIHWTIDGNSFDKSNKFIFFKDFEAGTYRIKCTLKLKDYSLYDDITLTVAKHLPFSENGFQNLEFDKKINDLEIDHNDELFFILSGNMPIINYTNSTFKKYYDDSYNDYSDIFIDSDQKLWVTSFDEYIKYIKDDELISIQLFENNLYINALKIIEKYNDPNTLIILDKQNKIYEFNKTTNAFYLFDAQPNHLASSYDIKYDSSGNLWISSRYNTQFFDGNTWIQNDSIGGSRCILIAENEVYIGDDNNGLFIYENDNWTNYNIENSNIPNNTIMVMNKDNNNLIYLGFNDYGIYTFKDGIFTSITNTQTYRFISEIDFFSDNRIVFSHSKGVSFEE